MAFAISLETAPSARLERIKRSIETDASPASILEIRDWLVPGWLGASQLHRYDLYRQEKPLVRVFALIRGRYRLSGTR